MAIYWYELKKLLSSVAVWGFIFTCLLFNIFLTLNDSGDKYADFVGTESANTGYILEQSFYENLSQLKASDERAKFLEQLKTDTDHVVDVFDGYEIKGVGESYIAALGTTGNLAARMREKYSALQKVVDEKASKNESLMLYFAGATYNRHQQLFNSLMGWLLIEGVFIAVLIVFLSVGYENIYKTEDVVYSTKKGRRILHSKIIVSMSTGIGAYTLLAFFTFLFYFNITNYGGIWNSSVSSVFNYRFDIIAGYRPFVTWYSFSILTYLMAALGMSIGLILCFSLMAFGIGMLIRNHYIGFLVFLSVNAAAVTLPMQMPQNMMIGFYARYYSMLTPIWLWLKHSIWFTDGDVDILWSHFETLGLCVSLLTLVTFCIFTAIYFKRRDLI